MNTRSVFSLSLLSIGLVTGACERKTEQETQSRTTTPERVPARGTDANNTDRNKADRDAATKTPMDQSNSSADIKITADIRRAVMEDASLSMDAKNCKIITDASGVVTLRGPVANQAEKDSIAAKAKAIAGVKSVVNELEVKKN